MMKPSGACSSWDRDDAASLFSDPDVTSLSPIPVYTKCVLNSSLLKSCWDHNIPAIIHSLETGADINHICESHGGTPLIQACKRNNGSEVIRVLLDYGANPLIQDSTGCNALHWACRADPSKISPYHDCDMSMKERDTVSTLLSYNPSIALMLLNTQDEAGFTPLHWAVWDNCVLIVPYLLQRGANPNIMSLSGTPLHLALVRGNAYLARLLCLSGADINVCTPKQGIAARLVDADSACCMRLSDSLKQFNSKDHMSNALKTSVELWAENVNLRSASLGLVDFFPRELGSIIVDYMHMYTPLDDACDDFHSFIQSQMPSYEPDPEPPLTDDDIFARSP